MSVQVVKLERPNPRQEEFLKCEKKYVAFGGARGGGKSWAVRTKAVLMALKYPGIRILLVRRTMPELESNHLRFLRRQLAGVAEYKAASRQLVFPGGSVLELGYCACDGDMDRYQGAEFDVICIDEATQLKEEWLRQFAACLRGVNEFPKRMYYTCNPGGPGHGYIKRLFIDRRYRAGERAEEYAFIPARVTDNQALLRAQPDYLRQLEALPLRLRQAWLEGKWDVFQGSSFRSLWTTRPTIGTGGSPTSLSPSISPESGASGAATTSAMPSPFPAAGGRWITTGACIGSWSCMAAPGSRTRG